MKKRFVVFVLMCVLSLGLWVTGCNPPEVSKPCVVMLGDSIFALSDEEGKVLFDLAGDTYRTYYIGGAQMVGGPIKTIEEQYYDAKADGPIRSIILDGGGNDILIGGMAQCSADYGTELSAECEELMAGVLAASERFFEMAVADGVKNVVFQGYYYVRYEKLWQVTDVFQDRGIQLVQELNVRYPDVKIVYVDPRPHFDRTNQDYLIADGIHPSDAGSAKLANLVWDAMVANGIEQNTPCPPSPGGCN